MVEVGLDDPLPWRLTRSELACVETGAESTCVIWKARRMGKTMVIFMLGERSDCGVLEEKRGEGVIRRF